MAFFGKGKQKKQHQVLDKPTAFAPREKKRDAQEKPAAAEREHERKRRLQGRRRPLKRKLAGMKFKIQEGGLHDQII